MWWMLWNMMVFPMAQGQVTDAPQPSWTGADFVKRDGGILTRCWAKEPVQASQIVGICDGELRLDLTSCPQWGVVIEASYFDQDRCLMIGPSSDGVSVLIMGHAPVLVEGVVQRGDFIVPSGKGNGLGRALDMGSWQKLRVKPRVIGMAKSSHPYQGVHLVDASLGFWEKDLFSLVCELMNGNKKRSEK
jgi:hypothetical protein